MQTLVVGQSKMNLLDCQLPVVSNLEPILKANNLNFPVPTETEGYAYNCWGFVAFALGWEKSTIWLSSYAMEDHLTKNTKPISKQEATVGDIVVFRCHDHLTHTALLTHEIDIIFHKPGACQLCIDDMDRAYKLYGKEVSYVRAVR